MPAAADTLYTYTGATFYFFQGIYTPSDRITGNFVLSDSFVWVPGGGPQSVMTDVASYSFTDGYQTLTQDNSTADLRVAFDFATGAPLLPGVNQAGWIVDIHSPTGGLQTSWVFNEFQVEAWIGGPAPSPYHFCNGNASRCYDDPTISTAISNSDGQISPVQPPPLPPPPGTGYRGSWTMESVPHVTKVPEGGTTALFLFAHLAGLVIATRFKFWGSLLRL